MVCVERLKPGRAAAEGLEVLEICGFCSGLKTDGGSEDANAHTVLKALMRGAAPKPDSKAVEYMRTTSPKDGWHAIAEIDGKSRVLVYNSPRWMRQKGERMLLIEKLPTTSAQPQDALRPRRRRLRRAVASTVNLSGGVMNKRVGAAS